jgi:thiol-disulfide isomerase/thioredoxin
MVICNRTILVFLLIFVQIYSVKSLEIVTIYASEFETKIKDYEHLLVNFYSQDCPHSQALEPIFKQLSEIVSKSFSNVHLAKVYIVGQQTLISKYDIRGTPSVILFNRGELVGTCYSEKTLRPMLTWLTKKIDGKVKALNKGGEIDQLWEKYSTSLVLFGNKDKCPSLYENYETSSKQYDDTIYSYCESSSCSESYRAQLCDIFLLKHTEEKQVIFRESKESMSLNDWINLNKQPLVNNFDEYSSALIFSHQNPAVIMFRDKEISGEANLSYENTIVGVAKKFKVKRE